MSRTTMIALVVLGATFAGFVIASNAQRLREDDEPTTPSVAAGPQEAELDWRETYGPRGEQLVFTVDWLEVTETGWRASIGAENLTSVAWKLEPGAVPGGSFGLSLYKTGDVEELEKRNQANDLPPVRAAAEYEPALPPTLGPGTSWEGEISAKGALVAGSFARVVFGTLIANGKPPEELGSTVVWITDSAYELEK